MALNDSGRLLRIAGPTVIAEDVPDAKLYDLVRVGEAGLAGEIVRIEGSRSTVQVYEDTEGLRRGEPVVNSGGPLAVELGPGMLSATFDGIQRPLTALREQSGVFIGASAQVPALDRERQWQFTPAVAVGDQVRGGDVLGRVAETPAVEHLVMVPPGIAGEVGQIESQPLRVDQVAARLTDGTEIGLLQRWPVRQPRPVSERLDPTEPFLTGQRVLDVLFPIVQGGSAIIPGGFGTGKTVVQQSLAKFGSADVIVYVGCGERGNEMTEVLTEFPEMEDPRTGAPVMDRLVLVANTSNMPVAAREASIFTGVTMAEYFRDMGLDVALMVDSTSRWAEALREISARLEEMPGEEGYPAYLGTRLAAFYERAGRVRCLGAPERSGSLTVVGAVSPSGGDFSEPVTQVSLRACGAFWALDSALAQRRHFPSVNWNRSYTQYQRLLGRWYDDHVGGDCSALIEEAQSLLQREEELSAVVQVVGPDGLSDRERAVMDGCELIREVFLQQNAFDPNDRYTPVERQFELLRLILEYHRQVVAAVDAGSAVAELLEAPDRRAIAGLRELTQEELDTTAQRLRAGWQDNGDDTDGC